MPVFCRDASLLDVADHADDREPRQLRAEPRLQPAAERTLVAEERLRQRLVDERDGWPADVATSVKSRPSTSGIPSVVRYVGVDVLVVVDVLERPVRRCRVALEIGVVGVDLPLRRQALHGRRALHARQLRQLRLQTREEVDDRLRRSDTVALGRTRPNVTRRLRLNPASTRIRFQKLRSSRPAPMTSTTASATSDMTSAAAHPGARGGRGRSLPRLLQRAVDDVLTQVQQRRQAEDDAGRSGDQDREHEHDGIEPDLARSAAGSRDSPRAASGGRRTPAPRRARRRRAPGRCLRSGTAAAAASVRRRAPSESRTRAGAIRRGRASGWPGSRTR